MKPMRATNRIIGRTAMTCLPLRPFNTPNLYGPDGLLTQRLSKLRGYPKDMADATSALCATVEDFRERRKPDPNPLGSSGRLRPVGLVLPHRRNALDLAQRVERAGTDAAIDDHEARMALDAVEATRNERQHDLVQPSGLRRVDANGDINHV